MVIDGSTYRVDIKRNVYQYELVLEGNRDDEG